MCDKFDGSEVTPENKNKMIKAIHKVFWWFFDVS